RLWSASSEFFRSRASLRDENQSLRQRERELALRTLRVDALEAENARLRALNDALPALVKQHHLVNVVNADLGRLRQRLIIDAGENAGLYRSQSLIDAHGLMGQLARVGPWSGELMLITDPEAAVPVEIVRNGVRAIAVGTGSAEELNLPLLPSSADVRAGDLLITSGHGGVFPAGIPVGTVTESRRDPDELLAHVRARPAASIAGSRQLLALWFDRSHPSAPPAPELIESLPVAPVAQPVTAPPQSSASSPAQPVTTPAAQPAVTPVAPATASPDTQTSPPPAQPPARRPGPR